MHPGVQEARVTMVTQLRTTPDPLTNPSLIEEPSPSLEPSTLNLFKIQRSCVHDGPGIRTTLFFRGCGLRCVWCQNPESFAVTGGDEVAISEVVSTVLRDRPFFQKTGGGVTLSGGDPLIRTRPGCCRCSPS